MTIYRYKNLTLNVGGVSSGTTPSATPQKEQHILIHAISVQLYPTTLGDYFRVYAYGASGELCELMSLRGRVVNTLYTWNNPCEIWLEPNQPFYLERDLQAAGAGVSASILYSMEDRAGPVGVTPGIYTQLPGEKKPFSIFDWLTGR